MFALWFRVEDKNESSRLNVAILSLSFVGDLNIYLGLTNPRSSPKYLPNSSSVNSPSNVLLLYVILYGLVLMFMFGRPLSQL